MTLQHCFAEYRSADRPFLFDVGSELARAVGQGASKLADLRRTGFVVSLLTRAPDEAYLAQCFPTANAGPEKTNS